LPVLTIIIRLCLAAVLGGLVGMERENKKRAAGFRTHILVSLGSALVMVTSEYIFYKYEGATNLDPARLGAQVISGIGFLGAGTIIRQGGSVKGLTTAASLWAVSCIGLAAGSGFYEAAVIAAIIVFVTLILLGRFEQLVVRKSDYSFELSTELENKPGIIGEVATILGKLGVDIKNIEFDADEDNLLYVRFMVQLPKGLAKDVVVDSVEILNGVKIIR
jgi:putative Mg2+ transporter-C (MgtC) family protein